MRPHLRTLFYRLSPSSTLRILQHNRRTYSTTTPVPPPNTPSPKPVSPHINIYKTFGRPFAKVFLMAFFSYQFLYWSWLKLEKEEVVREMDSEVARLESQVATLQEVQR